MKKRETSKDNVFQNVEVSHWSFIFGADSDSTTPSYVRLLTPTYNFTKLTELEHQRTFMKKKYKGLSWTVTNHIKSLLKINIVHCDANKPVVINKEGVTPAVTKIGGRKYKLIQEEVEEFLQNETPLERLRRTFSKSDVTKRYPEDVEVVKLSLTIMFICLTSVGLGSGSKEALVAFKRRNRFTLYSSAKAMNSRILLTLALQGFREAVKLNMKYLGFIVPAVLIDKCITVYRNKSSPFHFAMGFGISGGLYRFQLGPKGMFAGSVIAGTFGLVCGTVFYFVLSSTGYTQDILNRKAVFQLVKQERSYRRPEPAYENFDDDVSDDLSDELS